MGVLFTPVMVKSIFALARTFTHLPLHSLLGLFSLPWFPFFLLYFHGMKPALASTPQGEEVSCPSREGCMRDSPMTHPISCSIEAQPPGCGCLFCWNPISGLHLPVPSSARVFSRNREVDTCASVGPSCKNILRPRSCQSSPRGRWAGMEVAGAGSETSGR